MAAYDLAPASTAAMAASNSDVSVCRTPRGSRGSGTPSRHASKPGQSPSSSARSPAGRSWSCSRTGQIRENDEAGTVFHRDHGTQHPHDLGNRACTASKRQNTHQVINRAARHYAGALVPKEFVEAGKSAFAWHSIDAELAQLTYDSTHSPDVSALTRAESASIRALTFTSTRVRIELELVESSMLGQILPVQPATIEVQARDDAEQAITTDEAGYFSIHPIPRGPFRLRCRLTVGSDILTSWITLLGTSGRAERQTRRTR